VGRADWWVGRWYVADMTEEAKLEGKARDLADDWGCRFVKMTSPGTNGMQDRLLLIPSHKTKLLGPGHVVFCEVKKKDESPTPLQMHRMAELTVDGFTAVWFDSIERFRFILEAHVIPPDEDE
jgi:hypothetical protein